MARKTKIKKEYRDDYIHSPYQEAIFDYIQHEHGNLVVEASAGSGKSYTLIKSLDYIPNDKSILLAAFNRDIVNELKRKVSRDNVSSFTMHSLGLLMLIRNFGIKGDVDEFKYTSYIRQNVKKFSLSYPNLPSKDRKKYLNNVKQYVDFGRYYLCTCEKDLDFVEERYDIDTLGDEKSFALMVMEWGKGHLTTIDYTDMIWLPNALNVSPKGLQYDYIMIDECQDMNKAERELIMKCMKMGTRICSFGDKNQCLYAFSGADPNSFDALCSIPNTVKLPLSISYRCGKNIIKLAQTIVPTIEEFKDNVDGEVIRGCTLKDLESGDMVLCRNNAPLVSAYMELINMGKKAFIRGKDMGIKLKVYVKSMETERLNFNSRKDGLENRMYNDFIKEMYEIMDKHGIDEMEAINSAKLLSKLDMIMTIEGMCKKLSTTKELIDTIDSIFGGDEDSGDGIGLSTIHKAKGLEADNVYILCESLMPSKSAKQDWEKLQEKNLIYVSYTRAKKKLGFLIEDGSMKTNNPYDEISLPYLKEKEKICEDLYGTKRNLKVTNENAAKIASTAEEFGKQDVLISVSGGNVKSLRVNNSPTTNSSAIKMLFARRKKVKK